MTTSPTPRILLTGATGFIGGTILTHLLSQPSLAHLTFTCLVRGADRVAKLIAHYGDRVQPVLYEDVDDLETAVSVAAQHDVVLNAGLGYHVASAQALVRGLGERKAATRRDVWMIHTSGTSNVGDRPISSGGGSGSGAREFDDATDDIYGYEKQLEAATPYMQRTAELGVVDAGLALGVKTLVIMSGLIYGRGTGAFNQSSIQIPVYVRAALAAGRAVVVGQGSGEWDHVHVEDLAELYRIILDDILQSGGRKLPTGKQGIVFSGNGRHTWREVVQGVADACYAAGRIKDNTVRSVELEEGAELLDMGVEDENVVELGFCSNSRTVSTVARGLGWKPTRGQEAWARGLQDDVNAILGRA
ncbi:uncharacterized protein PG986_000833 [Apiospora aurea]|uniref:NAD-dependent epimerase/dehydratase domain-containing protein n=1 Tax=Apiospora aurea TaxID=335848 RepID=A0ABR1QW52_9PEZI